MFVYYRITTVVARRRALNNERNKKLSSNFENDTKIVLLGSCDVRPKKQLINRFCTHRCNPMYFNPRNDYVLRRTSLKDTCMTSR